MRTAFHLLLRGSLLAAGITSVACRTAPSAEVPASRPDVISRGELDSAGTASVYDAIARGHASFFRNRGRTSVLGESVPRAVVFLDAQYFGEIETLRNVPASRIETIRFYTGTDAASKFGSSYHGGVILLVSRVN